MIDSVEATATLTTQTFVGLDGGICKNGAKAYGVCDADTDKGQLAPVAVLGILLVKAVGVITKGVKVTSNAEGKEIPVSSSEEVNGYALDDASGDGDIIRIVRGI